MNFFNPNAIDGSIPLIVKPLNLAFGFGILAQIASSRISESAKSGAWMVGAAIFVGSMTIDTSLRNVSILHELSYFIGSALMCSGIGALRFKPLEKVGNMSYSLYLIHYPVLAATFIFLPKVAGDYDVNLYMFLGGAFVIVYIASATYYYIFEKVIHKQIRTRLLGR
jgi:peptidoglycan/LPS O-acetylase OafA/YrhL